MRVLILGAGGLGGYFGGRLVQAGKNVTFLVRAKRAARLRAEGLAIQSPLGDARLDVQAATADTLAGEFDLVILSCKAYDLAEAIAAIRPAVGDRTAILPLLNGLAHLRQLDEAFGPASVLGGLAHISATLAPDGVVRHFGKLDSFTFGERSETAADRARCDEIAAFLAGVPFTVRRSEHILQDMWEKFVFITAAAAITCLMRASVGAILAAPGGERLTLGMLTECEDVAAAAGFPVRDKAKEWSRSLLLQGL